MLLLSLFSLILVVLIVAFRLKSIHECIVCNHRYPFIFVKMINKHTVCMWDIRDFQKSKWIKLFSIKMNSSNSQKAVKLYERRDRLKFQRIKSYVDHNYTIEDNEVVSQMIIYVQLKNLEMAKKLLLKEEL